MPASADDAVLDVDGNGSVTALGDGIVVLRHLFGFRGDALVAGAVDGSATRDAVAISAWIESHAQALDVDGSGAASALTDGIVVLRFLFGFSGDALTAGALDGGATRATAVALAAHLEPLAGTRAIAFAGIQAPLSVNAGHTSFLSPHVNPIVANGSFIYVANTPANTVDVIEASTRRVVLRINVGVEPVGLAVRPDGRELWVANHISDSVSVIDLATGSPTLHQVIATVQAQDDAAFTTTFDEPTGIAFANSQKAYVALGPDNQIAVVDVARRSVVARLPIRAQDPRAITVRGNRLYVAAFESGNRTQLSGCTRDRIDGSTCTFDAVEHVFSNNNVLSLHYDADIVKNPALADRDLFVFDTLSDSLLQVVEGAGTLLYGVAVDGHGRVFVAQADARNDANGRAGTRKHGLAELENRAFLNRVTRIDCGQGCTAPVFYDLEPLPPQHPAPGTAAATPYAVAVSSDDQVLFVTAAGSNRLLALDASDGGLLDRVDVGAVPRGVALTVTPDTATAWILNVVDNSVSVVDVTTPANLRATSTIALVDPTPAAARMGRAAFNDANASTTGTFSCESCHPDGHTDQLLWVLDTPRCDVAGCTQIPPRLTMPVRGLRDTAPYHWDGIPGDPFGGINTASVNAPVAAKCNASDEAGCARDLVDGSLGTTLCAVGACGQNDEGKPGVLGAADRDRLAQFILDVPYPPAPRRAFDNVLSTQARIGIFDFNFTRDAGGQATGAPACGDCHQMPFFVSTNTPGTGMDAPTWRGAYDRFNLLPQGRLNIADLLRIVGIDDSLPEREIWQLAGATPDIWEMVLQTSTGFAGSFGRQVTLGTDTARRADTARLLVALESAAADGAVLLEGEGVELVSQPTALGVEYVGGVYRERGGARTFTREQLLASAESGALLMTLTARGGRQVSAPQPAVWLAAPLAVQTRNVDVPQLSATGSLRLRARHLQANAAVFLNGRRVAGSVRCESGIWPACTDETVIVSLETLPAAGGMHFLQLQNPEGRFSNDVFFYSAQGPLAARAGNLIGSPGTFGFNRFDRDWNTVEIAASSIAEVAGEVRVEVANASTLPWHAQISIAVMVVAGQQYSLCYSAKAQGARVMSAYVDTNLDQYRNLSGGQFTVNLTPTYQNFRHTFTASETDLRARVAFDFAQSALDVQIDNIGLFEGAACGGP